MAEPAIGEEMVAHRFQAFKDITAGTIGGVAQVLTAMPFDTIKVRLVCLPETYNKGPADCLKRTVQGEGILGLYKGTLSPIVGVGACVAIQFAVLEKAKRLLVDRRRRAGQSSRLSTSELYLCGFLAGGANSVVSSPVEHIRIRMQVQTNAKGEAGLYKSTPDCARKVLSQYGLRGFYKGFVPSIIRESFGYGLYFGAYELTKRWFMEYQQVSAAELGTGPILVAGAAAGFGMWFPMYPVDAIKSKMQGDSLEKPRFPTMRAAARYILKHEGPMGFFKGLGPCMLRAAPVNGATFLMFELTMRALDLVM